jgi:hypothetical protein
MKALIISILLFSVNLNAQSFDKYMQYINQAELMIVEGKNKDALTSYDSAFSVWKTPFAQDIRNALQCAVLEQEMSKCYEYAKSLILLGCDLKFFYNQQGLRPFISSGKWRRLTDEYAGLRKEYMQNCNWEMRAQIEQLKARDQYWRKQDPDYTILRDSTFREDDRIMEEILEIFKEGYPTEYEIGVFINSDTILSSDPLMVILLHNYTSNAGYKKGVDLTDILYAFAREGQMHPHVFASLNDRSGSYKLETGFAQESIIWMVTGKNYFEKFTHDQVEQFDRQRRKLGLDLLEVARKKAVFQHCTTPNLFSFFKSPHLNGTSLPAPILNAFFYEISDCSG